MKAIRKWYMGLNLRQKLVAPIYACMLVFFFLACAVFLSLSGRSLRQELRNAYGVTVQQISLSFEAVRENCRNISDFFSIDPEVHTMLRDANRGEAVRISDQAMRLMLTYPGILSVVFYDADGQVVDYVAADGSYGPLPQDGDRPLTALFAGAGNDAWEFIDKDDGTFMTRDNTPKLCLWRLIKNPNDYSVIGAVAIAADVQQVGAPLSDQGEAGLWISCNGRTVFQYAPQAFPDRWQQELEPVLRDEVGSASLSVGGSKLEAVYEQAEDASWFVSIVYPRPRLLQSEPNLFLYCFFVLTAFLLLLIPILLIIFSVLIRPIRKLTRSLMQFAQGDFQAAVSFESRDEIGIMGQVFNYMVSENRRQIETIYLLKLQEQRAELDHLQAQINPHFLYNVLDAIHWSALQNGSKDAAEMAYSLAQLFRLSLHRGERKIPLRDEMRLIDYYLRLQKIRYRERLSYTLSFAPDTLSLPVPKLLMQPLVENAVLHGIGGSGRAVEIRASSGLSDGYLTLCVEDDGCGIAPEVLARLPAGEIAGEGTPTGASHYALRNIDQRLKLEFQEAYRFTIESSPGAGTKVVIAIPWPGQNGGEGGRASVPPDYCG